MYLKTPQNICIDKIDMKNQQQGIYNQEENEQNLQYPEYIDN